MSGAAITGLGLCGPLGGLEETWRALAEGRRGVRAHALPEAPGLGTMAAAPAAPPDLSAWLGDPKLQKYMGRATELAVAAAGRALADAGALREAGLCDRAALFATTDLIAFDLSEVMPSVAPALRGRELDYAWVGARGFRGCHPLLPFKLLLNMPLGMVSIVFGLRGENFINYPNAQQSAVALQAALRGLASGRFERALVGASAHPLGLAPMTRALRLGQVARSPAQADPTNPEQRGLAPADAGAFLVLETEDEARRRGRSVRARLAGAASLGPDAFSGDEGLADELAPLCAEASAGLVPELAVATGLRSRGEVVACARALAQVWPARPPALLDFDGGLGHPGAAALLVAVALAARLLGAEEDPGAAQAVIAAALSNAESIGAARPRRALALCRDSEGGLAAAMLCAPEGAIP